MATQDYIVNLSDFTELGYEINAKFKNTIRIDGLTIDNINTLDFKIIDNNLEITNTILGTKLVVSNYTGITNIKTDYQKVGNKETYNLFNIISNNVVDNTTNPITTYNVKNLTITGTTNYNDLIRADLSDYVAPNSGRNKDKGLTINGGQGNDSIIGTNYNDSIVGGIGDDTILGGLGSDSIIGGIGHNTIKYNNVDELDGDKITLTKGENLDIDVTGIEIETFSSKVNGRNLDIIINGKTFTLINFGTTDVTNNKTYKTPDISSVNLIIKNPFDIIETVDLRTNGLSKLEVTKNYTGTWHADNISARDYLVLNRDGSENIKNIRGLNLNGGAGVDTIVGSKYNDTLLGGAGDDTISGGLGNDVITGGLGNNTIVYNGEFGTDTINLTKNENLTLDLTDYEITSLNDTNKIYTNLNGKDLKIRIADKGTIILKNYMGNVLNSLNIRLNAETLLENLTIDSFSLGYTDDDFTKNDRSKTATLTTSQYNDKVDVSAGLEGYTKTINGGNGDNTINVIGNGKVTVNGGTGVDNVMVTDNNFQTILNLGNGNNIVSILAETEGKGTGISTVTTGTGNDSITITNTGNATINSGAGADTIVSGSGNDTITAGDGEDLITGGKGNDKLTGGKNSDTFIFSKNDGVDTITDADNLDKIQITDVNSENLSYGKNGNNLEIYYDNTFDENNKIIVQNFFSKKEAQRVNELITQNGTVYLSNIVNNKNYSITGKGTINGTKENDNIVGSNSNDTIKSVSGIDTITGKWGNDNLYGGTTADSKTTFVFNVGDGLDTVYSGKGEDTLQFNNIDLSKLTFEQGTGKNNKDLVIKYSDNDSVTVKNYYTVDKQGNITGVDAKNSIKHFDCTYADGDFVYERTLPSADLVVKYNDNTFTIKNYFTNDIYSTLSINGTLISNLISNNINETYDYTNGCTVAEITSNGGIDSLKFTGALTYTHDVNNNDLVINYGYNKSVTIKDYFAGEHSVKTINGTAIETAIENNLNEIYDYTNGCNVATITSNGGVDSLKFSGNLTYTHDLTNADLVIGYGNDKTITLKDYFDGNHSVQYINGQAIETAIANNVNEIYDYTNGCTVSEITSNGGVDTIKFAQGTELTYERTLPSNDLIIKYDNQTLTLKNYFNNIQYSVINIDGTAISTLINGHLNETYDYTNGCTATTITSNGGNDSLKFTGALTYTHDVTNDDLIINYGNNKSVTIKNYFTGEHSVKTINGTAIETAIANNVNEIYDYTNGCTATTITSNGGNDSLKFTGNLTYVHNVTDNNLIINYGSNKSVTIKDYFAGGHSAKIINGTVISTLIEENLNEIYDYTNGCTVATISSNGGTDTLKFAENTILVYEHDYANDDLVIKYDDKSVTLKEYFAGSHSVTKIGNSNISDLINNNINETIYINDGITKTFNINGGVDTFVFDDDANLKYTQDFSNGNLTIENLNDNSKLTINGYFNNNNVVKIKTGEIVQNLSTLLSETGRDFIGTTSNDTITGTQYDDTITAAKGNDTISGGTGNNTYAFNIGDGNDTIINGEGTDTIEFVTEQANLNFSHNLMNNDLIISYGNKDSIVLKNYYVNGIHSVGTIKNGNTILTITEALNNYGINIYTSGLTYINDVNGTLGNDTIVNSSLIQGSIYGEDGNDNITNRGTVNQNIDGGSGDDSIISSNATVIGTISGGSGNDTIIVEDNANYYYWTKYINNVDGGANNDNITINFAEVKGSVIGGDGDDNIINKGYVYQNISGGDGNDTIINGNGIYAGGNILGDIDGGNGNDSITNKGQIEGNIIGGLGDDTIINQKTTGIIKGYISSGDGNDSITNNGTVYNIHGNEGNDIIINNDSVSAWIYGDEGNDTITNNGIITGYITGGEGNDKLYSGSGNSSYIFNVGDGHDTIYSGTGTDSINIDGVSFQDISYSKSNNDLIIKYSANDDITLKDYFSSTHSVKNINGTSISQLIANNLNEVYDYTNGCTVSEITSNGGNDSLIFTEGTVFTYERTLPSNNLVIKYGNKSVTLKDYFTNNEHSVKTINGTSIRELIVDNVNEIYDYTNGCTVSEITSNGGSDTLKFSNISNLIYTKNNNDLVITYDSNKTVTLKDYYITDNYSVQKINTTALSTAYANGYKKIIVTDEQGTISNFNEVVVTNTGSVINEITGGDENNNITVQGTVNNITSGNGIDTITVSGTVTGTINTGLKKDIITVESVGSVSSIYADQGDDVINVYGSVGSIMGGCASGVAGSDTITVYNGGEVYNIGGDDGADVITVKSGGTVNNINGSRGNDTITVEQGADVEYISFYNNHGNDTLYLNAGVNNLRFGMNNVSERISDLNYTLMSDGSLIIRYNSNKDSVTIENYNYYNENIQVNIQYYEQSGNEYILRTYDIKNLIQDQVKYLSPKTLTDGNDEYHGSNLIDNVDGGKGNDTIYGSGGNDILYGGENDTGTTYGVPGNDNIYGEDGDDYIKTSKGYEYTDMFGDSQTMYSDNYVDGGAGNDTIKCYNGNNTILGGSGNDTISVGIGTNIITGGTGNDIITVSNGVNTFNFNEGDGNDTIIDGTTADIIKFNDYNLNNLKWEKSDNSLVIKYGENYADSVTINNYFNTQNNNRIIVDNFENTSSILGKAVINTTASNGGTYLDDVYTLTASDLNPTITSSGGNDTLYFENTIMDDLQYRISGNDFCIGFNKVNGQVRNWAVLKDYLINENHSVKYIKTSDDQLKTVSDTFTITQGFTVENNAITGTRLNDRISAASTTTAIYGGAGNDTITGSNNGENLIIAGGRDNDTITVGTTQTTLTFNNGDGNDIITTFKETDTLEFTGTDLNSLTWNKNNEDLIIGYGNNDSVTLKDYFLTGYNISLKNGDSTSAIYNKFLYNPENKSIIEIITRGDLLDFPFSIEEFYNSYRFGIKQDGPNVRAAIVKPNGELFKSILLTVVPEYSGGYYEDFTIYVSPTNINTDVDSLYIRDVHVLVYTRLSDTYSGYASTNKFSEISIKKESDWTSTSLRGGVTNNILYGKDFDNVNSGQGDDYLYGGYGSTFIFNRGDGNDTLYTYNSSDKLSFDVSDFVWEKTNNDLIIKYNNSTDSLTIKNYFVSDDKISNINNSTLESKINHLKITGNSNESNNITGTQYSDVIYCGNMGDTAYSGLENDTIYGGNGNDSLYGEDGNDTIYGNDGNDTIDSGSGNNELYGGTGDDTYIVSTDLSNIDTIFDESGDNDCIEISQVNKNDIILRFDLQVDNEGNILDYLSKNMYITSTADFGNTAKGIKVTDQFVEGNSIETITTADSYALTTTDINQLRENVAGWLHNNGFESVQQILDSGNETNINNLIAQFQAVDWQQVG